MERSKTQAATERRFDQINASWAIEGQVMDARDLHLQQRIARGEVTAEEAIQQLREEFGVGGSDADAL